MEWKYVGPFASCANFFISENSEIFQENLEFLEYSQNRGILHPYFGIFQEYSLFSVNIPNYLKYSKQFGFRDVAIFVSKQTCTVSN